MNFTEEQTEFILSLLERESKHIKEIYKTMLSHESATAAHIEETTNHLEKINEMIKIIKKEKR
jgi:hypothetical protein|tara:strand:- start:122 stop:310 length:189 start_codon:yes stop_codon:yes gene_type:complete